MRHTGNRIGGSNPSLSASLARSTACLIGASIGPTLTEAFRNNKAFTFLRHAKVKIVLAFPAIFTSFGVLQVRESSKMPLHLVGETIDKARGHYRAETGKLVQLH